MQLIASRRCCLLTLVTAIAVMLCSCLTSQPSFGQGAEIKELNSAIGDDGFAHNASQDRHICIQIKRHPDEALHSLARAHRSARSSVERIVLEAPCMQTESLALLSAFDSLRILDVCEAAWAPSLSKVVARSESLKEVWAEAAGINGDDLRAICKAKQLRVLMIGHSRFKGRDMACLADLTNLTQLSLGGNEMETKDLEFVSKLENLTWLELIDTQLDDGIIPFVSNCKKLKILSLGKNRLTPEGRAKLSAALPSTIISLESDTGQ